MQQKRADKAKEYEADRIFSAGHLRIRVNKGNPVDDPLDGEADSME